MHKTGGSNIDTVQNTHSYNKINVCCKIMGFPTPLQQSLTTSENRGLARCSGKKGLYISSSGQILPDIYVSAAASTTDKIMNTIAVHFQVHFEVRPFRNWNRDCGKWLELGRRKLLRTGRTGTGVPNGKEHLK